MCRARGDEPGRRSHHNQGPFARVPPAAVLWTTPPSGVELASEDLGVREDLRSSSLRMDQNAPSYQSSADANVWLRYRRGVDDYLNVYVLCTS